MRATSPVRLCPVTDVEANRAVDERFSPIAEAESVRAEWLLPGRIMGGAITILEGDPGVGKSTLLSELAAVVTTGRPWLGRPKCDPRGVLWLTSEEDPRAQIQPRLERAQADLSRVRVLKTGGAGSRERVTLPGSVGLLRDACSCLNLGLILLDPLVSFVSEDTDLNQETSCRHALDPAAALCQDTGVSLVMIRQLKKDRTGPRITHGLGGMALAAAARCILQLDRPDEGKAVRMLRAIKCSGGQAARPLCYALLTGEGAPIMTGVRELAEGEDDPHGDLVDAGDRHVRCDARQLLLTLLQHEWVRAATVIKLASEAGIGERTLWKVKAELSCASRRVGGGADSYSEWGPPGSADPPPPPPAPGLQGGGRGGVGTPPGCRVSRHSGGVWHLM